MLQPSFLLSWEGPEDNKPLAELQAMDDPTLAWEAQGPCVKATITTLVATPETIGKRREAQRYLASLIAMKQKKDGKAPPWLYDLVAQAEKGSLQGCNDVTRKVYLPPEAPAAGQDQQAAAQGATQQEAASAKK